MAVNITDKNRSPLVSSQVKGQDDSNATVANQKAIHNHLLAVVSQGVKELSSSQKTDFEELIEKDMITILAMVAMLQVLSQEGRALFNLPATGSTDSNSSIPSKDTDDSASPTGSDTNAPSTEGGINAIIANFLANGEVTGGSTDSLLESIEDMIAELTGGSQAKDKTTLSDLQDKGLDLACSLLKDLCGELDPKFIASITKLLISAGVIRKSFESLISNAKLPPKLAFILQTVSAALEIVEAIGRMPNPTEQKINQMVGLICAEINAIAKNVFDNIEKIESPFSIDIKFKIDFSDPLNIAIGVNTRISSGSSTWESAIGISGGVCSVGPNRDEIYD